MSSKGKKNGVIVVSVIAVIVGLMVAIPFLFKDKIKEVALNEVNKQLTADVGFDKIKISLIKNFPNASVTLKDLYIAGRGQFEGDTLLQTEELKLVVNMKSVFSANGFEIKRFVMNSTSLFAHELENGEANWNIVPEADSNENESSSSFALQLQDVRLLNTDIVYVSDTANMAAKIENLNLYLKGDLTAQSTLLKTRLDIEALSFWNEGIQMAHGLALDFEADIDADLDASRYTLANNIMHINAIPLSLNGWVAMPDESMQMDLTLNAEKVDFKSLLSLIPAIYATEFEQLQADGRVSLTGFIKGEMHDDVYPAFDFSMNIDNGRFSYPDLPKSVDQVNVASRISSEGGDLDNTVVDISNLSFAMGGNPFKANMRLTRPISNMHFTLSADGKLDLGMVEEVFPLEDDMKLNGLLTVDVNATGDMQSVENNRFEDLRFGGNVNVKDMLVNMPDMKQEIAVSNAQLIFNDRYLNLADLDVKIGDNDLQGSGKVENYIAYALRNQTLSGGMKIQSNHLNLNDFMMENEGDTTSMTVIEVPNNLNLTLDGNFKTLLYDQMKLENAVAQLQVANGELHIKNMNVNAFGGTMAMSGKYSTVNLSEPIVDFDLDLKQISFGDIMKQVESLKKIAPIFDKLSGRFDTKLSLHTLLSGDMMPILSSMLSSGSFKAEMITLKEDIATLNALTQSLKIDKFSNMALKDLALAFDIKDGMLETKPFDIKIKDYLLNIGGLTGLDQSIAYKGNIRLPDNLNLKQFQNIGFKIGGTFQSPKVELDLKSTLTNIIDEQKDKLTDKVDAAKEELTDKGKEVGKKAMEDAQRRANLLIEQANEQGQRLIDVAKVQRDSIVSKAKNPIAKELARKGADELVRQAEKQAQNIVDKAQGEADKILKEAE